MTRPFRPRYDMSDWAVPAVMALIVVAAIGFIFWIDAQREEDCLRKGGQYVHVYRAQRERIDKQIAARVAWREA
jgi:hypothetical protein